MSKRACRRAGRAGTWMTGPASPISNMIESSRRSTLLDWVERDCAWAKTPRRSAPPSRGGRTVGDQARAASAPADEPHPADAPAGETAPPAPCPVADERASDETLRRRSAGRAVFELPQQPQVRELLEPRHRRRQRELRLEHDAPLQVRRQEAIARNAELLRKDWFVYARLPLISILLSPFDSAPFHRSCSVRPVDACGRRPARKAPPHHRAPINAYPAKKLASASRHGRRQISSIATWACPGTSLHATL